MKSTIAIVIILIILIGAGAAYYYSAHSALAPTTGTSTPAIVASSTTTTITTTTTSNPDTSTWKTNTETQAGFSIAHPANFTAVTNTSTAPTTDWRLNSSDPGIKVLTLAVPSSFEPKTNFVDATLTVGYSQNTQAIANCLTQSPGSGPLTATTTVTINGINFTVFHSSDVGAGNIYKTTSYRALHAGACYAVEYSVHSAQLGNFPPSEGLTQYSDTPIDQALDQVVGTFKFL